MLSYLQRILITCLFTNSDIKTFIFNIRINLEEQFERDMDEINNRSSSDESSPDSSHENISDNSLERRRKYYIE